MRYIYCIFKLLCCSRKYPYPPKRVFLVFEPLTPPLLILFFFTFLACESLPRPSEFPVMFHSFGKLSSRCFPMMIWNQVLLQLLGTAMVFSTQCVLLVCFFLISVDCCFSGDFEREQSAQTASYCSGMT